MHVSFPRKREPSDVSVRRWVPAYAGTTTNVAGFPLTRERRLVRRRAEHDDFRHPSLLHHCLHDCRIRRVTMIRIVLREPVVVDAAHRLRPEWTTLRGRRNDVERDALEIPPRILAHRVALGRIDRV